MSSSAASATVDEYAVYPFPLPDDVIAAIGQERVFYYRGETGFSSQPASIVDDSTYQNTITCEADPHVSANCPNLSTGSVDNSLSFSNSGSQVDNIPVWVEPASNLDLSGNNGHFTIAAWLNPQKIPTLAGHITSWGMVILPAVFTVIRL